MASRVELIAHLDQVDVLLAIESDLLSTAPGHLRYARDFASRRNPSRAAPMSRIYAIESTPTLIGSVADHRFIAGPAEIAPAWVGRVCGRDPGECRAPSMPDWVSAVIADLKAARGRALVHVGPDSLPQSMRWRMR